MRELERMACEYGGFAVSTAVNGRQALEALERADGAGQPSVILLDLMMPGMDGLTFLAERHRRGLHEHIPVICVSAAGPEFLARAMDLGAVECLNKPVDFDDLCARLADYHSH